MARIRGGWRPRELRTKPHRALSPGRHLHGAHPQRCQARRFACVAAMYATALERGGRRGEGLSPNSVRMMHGLLVQAFKQAVKWHLIARNPVDAVSAPRVERRQ